MPKIADQQDNPDGLHKRYIVTKANGEPVDENAVYFVLRLDMYGDDIHHIMACRFAARVYAGTILQQRRVYAGTILQQRDTEHLHTMAKELLQLLEETNIGNGPTNSQTES